MDDLTALIERAARYYAAMFRKTCPRSTPLDWEDCAQEIRIKCHMTAIPEGAKPASFIMKTAYFRYYHVRRTYIRRSAHFTPMVCEPADETHDTSAAEDIWAHVTAIASARDRAICTMYFHGVKRAEIARTFGLSRERINQILKACMGGAVKGTSPRFLSAVGAGKISKDRSNSINE